jgi:hypothetical protein
MKNMWTKVNSFMTIHQNKFYLAILGIVILTCVIAGILESQREIITITITK